MGRRYFGRKKHAYLRNIHLLPGHARSALERIEKEQKEEKIRLDEAFDKTQMQLDMKTLAERSKDIKKGEKEESKWEDGKRVTEVSSVEAMEEAARRVDSGRTRKGKSKAATKKTNDKK